MAQGATAIDFCADNVRKPHSTLETRMHRLPSLNALKAFEAASRHLSFTRAAAELHVTHGAVSRQVSQLEGALGTALFVRGSRGLELTTEGAALARGVAGAFDLLRRAVQQASHKPSLLPLRVSVPPTLAMWWLIPRMSLLHEACPNLRLELSTSIEPVDFASGHYDAAIRRVDRLPKGLSAERFLDARPAPVCSPDYKRRHRLRRAADLGRATLITTRSEPGAWSAWLRSAALGPDTGTGVVEFEQLYFALQAALDGLGVALAPAALVAAEVQRGRLCLLSQPQGPVTPSYALLWPRAGSSGETIRLLADWLLQAQEEA
ncbi:MAG: LysR family transcriptional regulator [Comamonadaceae bacterium]|nr:MAG: LysR family transcriptional regulator [Comamonadaceae bacterium]